MKKNLNILFLIIILCCSFILSNKLKLIQPAEYLPNSNFLYRGYDIFYADLMEGNVDPGFRRNIFDATYNNQERTSDRRYFVPDGLHISRNERCSLQVKSTTITGEESYMKSFENELSVTGTIKGVTFSASNTFKQVSEDTSKNSKAFIYSKSECTIYSGEIDTYEPPSLHRSFRRAIENLSRLDFNQNKEDYWNFISSYGTHFITQVKMGARFGAVSKTTQEEIGRMRSQGIGIEAGIGIKDIFEINNKSTYETKQTSNLLTRMEDVNIFSIGSRPSDDLTEAKWANQVFTQPMPISYRVASILDIFDSRKIFIERSQFSNIDLNFLIQNLKDAYDNYCESYLLPNRKVRSCTIINRDSIINTPKADIIGNGNFFLENIATQTCLTFDEVGKRAVATPCDKRDSQNIFFTNWATHQSTGWLIKPESNHQHCFEGNIVRWCVWNWTDMFDILLNNDKTYTIRLQHRNECVEVKDANKAVFALVQLNNCNNQPEQRWRATIFEFIHIVRSGDTLIDIARRYNTTLDQILRLNPHITRPDLITGGLKVRYK